jgi:ribosomal-protein-alanine N-acetyltransferase
VIVLETERLILRRLEMGDLDDLARLYADPEVRRHIPEGVLNREQTQEELEWFLNGHPERSELGLWGTIHRATGAFIGRCGLLPWDIDGVAEVEVAYLIDPEYQGQGFATEAAAGVRDHAFGALGLRRLICLITPGNEASVKVAEKIGMRFEREGSDDEGPFLLYSCSVSE